MGDVARDGGPAVIVNRVILSSSVFAPKAVMSFVFPLMREFVILRRCLFTGGGLLFIIVWHRLQRLMLETGKQIGSGFHGWHSLCCVTCYRYVTLVSVGPCSGAVCIADQAAVVALIGGGIGF